MLALQTFRRCIHANSMCAHSRRAIEFERKWIKGMFVWSQRTCVASISRTIGAHQSVPMAVHQNHTLINWLMIATNHHHQHHCTTPALGQFWNSNKLVVIVHWQSKSLPFTTQMSNWWTIVVANKTVRSGQFARHNEAMLFGDVVCWECITSIVLFGQQRITLNFVSCSIWQHWINLCSVNNYGH